MLIDPKRYTSGRIALGNLSSCIDSLDRRRLEGPTLGGLSELSKLLFLRGDLMGRIADHERAQVVAREAAGLAQDPGTEIFILARLAARFHRFGEASKLLYKASLAGYPASELEAERASLLQATGRYREALVLREGLAQDDPGIHTLGALATLLAEMDRWVTADYCYAAALATYHGVSPFPCAQLLFEWGVSAMRCGDLDRAESLLAELQSILPEHVPGRGHRAKVALARRQLDLALALIKPLLAIADDPEYRATYAETLAARGDEEARVEAQQASLAYERLLGRRHEAYADHAADFFMGIGSRPQRAVELATANWRVRDTPRARRLLDKAIRRAQQASAVQQGAA